MLRVRGDMISSDHSAAADAAVTLGGHRFTGPAHVCAFFESPDEKYDLIVPFFREGLERGERVLNVVEDPGFSDHASQLRAAGIAVNGGRAGTVELYPVSETYFRGGSFDPLSIFGLVEGKLADANEAGAAIRTFGEMSWVADAGMPAERVMEYEARVNRLTAHYRCTLVCGYDLGRVSGALLSDIVATHPYVLLNGRVRENPWYVDPHTYLEELLRAAGLGREEGAEAAPAEAAIDEGPRAGA